MANVLVVAETRAGELRSVALEVVTAARKAADASGGEVHALVFGAPGAGAAAQESLGRHGADLVIAIEGAGFEHYDAESLAATTAERLRSGGYRAGFFAASAQGRDLAPRVAAALGVSLASDVIGLELTGDALVVQHPVYVGKAIATLRLTGTPALASIRPGAVTAAEAARTARLEAAAPASDPASSRVKVREMLPRGDAMLDLGEAPVIVAGGRGLRAAENFRLVEELAAAFGNAAVGATRAVTDDGWRPATDQIGQTGRMVNPNLYVAVGISGAIQHLAGMRTSGTIVAINRDKDAPIFKLADYGIVGDLFEIVPRLTEEIRKARSGG
jgi:electron transfer flavoprotein alpha subunit